MVQVRFTIFLLILSLGVASAQVPYVPAELLDNRLRLQGDHVTTCIFRNRDTTEFDRAVAELVAESLLLTHDIVEIPADFPIYAEEDLYSELYRRLVNECDLVAGFSLQAQNLAEWLGISAAYASLPFVVITRDQDHASLSDIPRGEAIGVQIGSLADMNFLSWNLSVPVEQRWLRLPYGEDSLMLTRLDDGSISAAFIWLPNLLQKEQGLQGDYRVISSSPVPETVVSIGFVALANQSWLLEQVDAAIAELHSSGALSELAVAHGIALPDND